MDSITFEALPFPSVIRIEPSSACNLACRHCPSGTEAMQRGIMDEKTFGQVLRAIEPHAQGVRVAVLYHGGEPLLNRHFPEMVCCLRGLGIPFIKTVSNGMLLDEVLTQQIIDSGLDAIEFSLDGKSPDENNFFRRQSDYLTVVRNVKRLLDRRRAQPLCRLKVYISSTQFAQGSSETLEPPSVPEHLKAEFSGPYQGEVEFKCTWAMRWPLQEVLAERFIIVPSSESSVSYQPYCDHVVNTLTIRWNGDIVPCCFDLKSSLVLGNIDDADLLTIWNSERFRSLRQAIQKQEPLPLCADCNVIRHPKIYLAVRPELDC
ncbi:MAG: radical SAM/SPASM domain-containing protein [Desulfurivibrionaceae bacterium]